MKTELVEPMEIVFGLVHDFSKDPEQTLPHTVQELEKARYAIADAAGGRQVKDLNGAYQKMWDALEAAREEFIPEGDPDHDEEWEEVCNAMDTIKRVLEVETN